MFWFAPAELVSEFECFYTFLWLGFSPFLPDKGVRFLLWAFLVVIASEFECFYIFPWLGSFPCLLDKILRFLLLTP
jgi:hypothetical protein